MLAACELEPHRRRVPVVVGGLDQEPAGVPGPALVILPWRRCSSEVRSEGTIPR